MASGYFIEEVASRTGLTARTLRFWEEKGLLVPSARTEGGMRLYSEQDIARCERIRDLKEYLGLSLDVVREILTADDEVEALRREACQHLPEERVPFIRQAVGILEAQVDAMEARASRILELRHGYVQRLETLRERLRQLEG